MRGFAGVHRHDLRRDLVHLALQVVEIGLELSLVQLSGFDLIVVTLYVTPYFSYISVGESIPEVGFVSFINHLQCCMDFFVGFLCNENLLRVLYSGIGYKLIFKTAHGKRKMRFVYTQEKKISRVSRGAQPLGSGSSNRDERIPVGIGYPKGNSVALGRGIQRGQRTPWHTILLAKSSVLYLLFREAGKGMMPPYRTAHLYPPKTAAKNCEGMSRVWLLFS